MKKVKLKLIEAKNNHWTGPNRMFQIGSGVYISNFFQYKENDTTVTCSDFSKEYLLKCIDFIYEQRNRKWQCAPEKQPIFQKN